MAKRKQLSEISPLFYNVAVKKETVKRHMENILKQKTFSTEIGEEILPNIVYKYASDLIKTGKDIDPILQENKAFNINLSASKINGIIIHPNEEFSFWKLVGKIKESNGYREGRVIINNKVQAGIGGGLCNLANSLNLLVLHSPLEITEFHNHSDALAPDNGERKPLKNGTSVSYNYVDYRFKNTTSQNMQVRLWCEENKLFAELRSEHELAEKHYIVEEDHHFVENSDKYYRKSKIYKITQDAITSKTLKKS